jgi:hypothetical protein
MLQVSLMVIGASKLASMEVSILIVLKEIRH